MKGFGFNTILLGLVMIVLLVSFALLATAMYRLANAKAFVWTDDTTDPPTITKGGSGLPATKYWGDNKMLLIAPSIMNVACMLILGALVVVG